MVDPASETELNVSVIVLAREASLPSSLTLSYRKLGAAEFESTPLPRVAQGRGWYTGKVPLTQTNLLGSGDFEYRVQATMAAARGQTLVYPAAGTVVVTAIPQ